MIYGYHKVDVENIDHELCWKVYIPKTNNVLLKVHYKNIFTFDENSSEFSSTESSNVILLALETCLSSLGMPCKESIDRLFTLFPEIRRTPTNFASEAIGEYNKRNGLNLKKKEVGKKTESKSNGKVVKNNFDEAGNEVGDLEWEEPEVYHHKRKRKLNI